MTVDFLLFESSVGYAIFKVRIQGEAIGNKLLEVQKRSEDLSTFGKMIELVSFAPFQTAVQALENANEISEGIVSDFLASTLEANLPGRDKNKKLTLGVADKNLAASIKQILPHVDCETADTSEVVGEFLRGLRSFGPKLLGDLPGSDMLRAQLGLGHAFSRAKVKFSVQKNDNHVIQAIAILDHLDKAINTFLMRVREWYSWHFPELIRLVSDNESYARLAYFIGNKSTLSEDKLDELSGLAGNDEDLAKKIIASANVSMGRDMSEMDMKQVKEFAQRAIKLADYRHALQNYLSFKMSIVAPNVSSLIGDAVGARLISKAGSLTNLAKCSASTVQILGAEKALFRALRTKGNTPKYGLIYHSSFIARAGPKNKGRISRFLANKTTVAARIDNFSEHPSRIFGECLRQQVEERLDFLAKGTRPSRNVDVMKRAMDQVLSETFVEEVNGVTRLAKKEKKTKRLSEVSEDGSKLKGKKSKSKKKKHEKENEKTIVNGVKVGDKKSIDEEKSDKNRNKMEGKEKKKSIKKGEELKDKKTKKRDRVQVEEANMTDEEKKRKTKKSKVKLSTTKG